MSREGGNPEIYGYKKDFYRDKVQPKWEMIGAWARSGLANTTIAKNCGVSVDAFKKYLEEQEDLADWVRECREDAEIVVENALFKRATGFEYEEVTKERKMNEDGNYKLVVVKKVLKQVAPDVGAAQYWLEHRAPNKWTRNPVAGANIDGINGKIVGLAALITKPVAVRAIGSENE